MNYIKKVNKYLLEQYPLIWNTRLVWMLGINILVHLLFFTIGYSSVNNIEDLKFHYRLNDFYFGTEVVYYNVLISTLVLLVWIIFYLRNNAFKNLYNLKKGTLFKQFGILLFIFFISITQYYSFKKGIVFKIKQLYSWEEIDSDIKDFNRTAIFLAQEEDNYKIDKKKYPLPFPLKVIKDKEYEHDSYERIDTTKAYIKHKGNYYQFYNVDEKLWKKDNENSKDEKAIYREDFKYRIVKDVSKFKNLINYSLLNYSRELYSFGQDSLAYKKQLESHVVILTRKKDSEIKKELTLFINLANKYEVNHNLEKDKWFGLLNNKPDYLIKKLINKTNPEDRTLFESEYYEDNKTNEYYSRVQYSKKLYCNLGNLDNLFKKIHEAYYPKEKEKKIYMYITIAFLLGLVLFIFKTTDLKSLLLSSVSAIVVMVFIMILMNYVKSFIYSVYSEFLIMISVSILIIILAIISYAFRWKKIIISILFSLASFALPTLIVFVAVLYGKYLARSNENIEGYKNEFMLWFEEYGFWAIMLIWLAGIFLYSTYIRKLKARPE